MIAGEPRSTAPRRSRVVRTTRWAEVVPHWTTAAGVSGERPPSTRHRAICSRCAIPINTTTVPPARASESQSTPPGAVGSPTWPVTTVTEVDTPRWVTGIPAVAGTPKAELTPGTTCHGTPARSRASPSSPPRPKTKGSPPLSRTTSLPGGTVRDQQVVDVFLAGAARLAGSLAHVDQLRVRVRQGQNRGVHQPVVDHHVRANAAIARPGGSAGPDRPVRHPRGRPSRRSSGKPHALDRGASVLDDEGTRQLLPGRHGVAPPPVAPARAPGRRRSPTRPRRSRVPSEAVSASAPTGAAQLAPRAASTDRSARRWRWDSGSSRPPNSSAVEASSSRHSMARAPCPTWGSICSGLRTSAAWSSRSSRRSAAIAVTTASTVPSLARSSPRVHVAPAARRR